MSNTRRDHQDRSVESDTFADRVNEHDRRALIRRIKNKSKPCGCSSVQVCCWGGEEKYRTPTQPILCTAYETTVPLRDRKHGRRYGAGFWLLDVADQLVFSRFPRFVSRRVSHAHLPLSYLPRVVCMMCVLPRQLRQRHVQRLGDAGD